MITSGFGILVIGIFLVFGVAIEVTTKSQLGEDYYQTHGWPGFLACLLSAPVIWIIGRWLNRPKMKEVTDARTGEKISILQRGDHSLFFIPMEYWSLIVMALSIYYLLKEIIGWVARP